MISVGSFSALMDLDLAQICSPRRSAPIEMLGMTDKPELRTLLGCNRYSLAIPAVTDTKLKRIARRSWLTGTDYVDIPDGKRHWSVVHR